MRNKTFWAYQGSAYQAPLYVFQTKDEAIDHAIGNGELDGKFKDEWLDWEDREIQQWESSELLNKERIKLEGWKKIEFISMEAA